MGDDKKKNLQVRSFEVISRVLLVFLGCFAAIASLIWLLKHYTLYFILAGLVTAGIFYLKYWWQHQRNNEDA